MRNPSTFYKSLVPAFVLLAAGALFNPSPGAAAPPAQDKALRDISARIAAGRAYLQAGDSTAALKVFQDVLAQDPENAEAHYQIGAISVRRKQYPVGIRHIRKAISLDPGHLDWHLGLASVYEYLKRYSEALAEYRAARHLAEAGSEEARKAGKKITFILATQHARKGEIDKALEMFSRLADEYPDDFLIIYSQGVAYLLKNRLKEAELAFNKVVRLAPRYANAYLSLATVHERRGNPSDAVSDLKKVIQIAPEGSVARKARLRLGIIEGRSLIREGNLQEAFDTLQGVLAIDPAHPAALYSLGEIYQRRGETAKAENVYKKLLKIAPDNLEVRFRLAETYVDAHQIKKGIQALEAIVSMNRKSPFTARSRELLERLRATGEGRKLAEERQRTAIARYQDRIASDPDDLEAHLRLGELYFRGGDLRAARQEYEAVKRIAPRNKKGLMALGVIYDSLGLNPLAVDAYANAIALEEDAGSADQLARALQMVTAKKLYQEGRLKSASMVFDRILSIDPANAMAYFYQGLIHAREDEFSKAVESYREVLRLVPGHVGARLNLALIYERLNRDEDAINEYRKILEANPPGDIAARAKTNLEAAEKRVKGFSSFAGYSMAFDSNSNLSQTDPVEDFRSDLSVNLAYRYKMRNGLRWQISTAPAYSTFLIGEFDFLQTGATVSATIMPRDYTLTGGFTRGINKSLIVSRRFSNSNFWFLQGQARKKMPPFFRPLSSDRVPTSLSLNLTYTDFDSTGSSFFNARTYAVSGAIEQRVGKLSILNLGYAFTINDNKAPLGSDYAYRSNGITANLQHGLLGKIVANVRYGFTLFNYTNPDSGFGKRRRNVQNSLGLGASYRFHKNFIFTANYSWTRNDSNLPVGFVLSSLDVVEGVQSSSLGNYSRSGLSAGFSVNF